MVIRQVLMWLALCAAGLAQTLELEPGLVTRNDVLKGTLKLTSALSGPGRLTLTWTDSYGRTVAVESQKVSLTGKSIPFQMRLRRAVALSNFVSAELIGGSTTVKAGPIEFIVTPNESWYAYQVIMY